MPNTLYDKIWNDHLVDQQTDGTSLLFVDRHLVHEVTSAQSHIPKQRQRQRLTSEMHLAPMDQQKRASQVGWRSQKMRAPAQRRSIR